MAQVTGRAKPLDKQREGVILVRERTQNGLLDPDQQRRECRVALQVGAQNHRVGNVADQTVQPRLIAASEG